MSSDRSLPCIGRTALPFRRYWRVIGLQRLRAPKTAERNGVVTTTEVEVPGEGEVTATDMATGMAMGTATETATGMVMDVVTETAMEMVMEEVTGVAMEMVTEMAMRLVVEEVEVEEAPQPVVGAAVVVVVEEEEEAVVVGVGAAAAVAEVVIDMIFALGSRIVQVLMWQLSFSGHMSL